MYRIDNQLVVLDVKFEQAFDCGFIVKFVYILS